MVVNARKTLNEKGMALITSVLILAAASVIAIALSVGNTVETRIAANQKATEVAFRNAEAGLEHARLRLATRFSTDPRNLLCIRLGQSGDVNWDFLFTSTTPSTDPCADLQWDEVLLDLGNTMDMYKVFVRDSEDLDSLNVDRDHRGNGIFDSGNSTIDTDQMVILRSIGFGPGPACDRGNNQICGPGPGCAAQQVVELRIWAKPQGTHSGYYAQEGGGPTKANVNVRDREAVNGGLISPGMTIR